VIRPPTAAAQRHSSPQHDPSQLGSPQHGQIQLGALIKQHDPSHRGSSQHRQIQLGALINDHLLPLLVLGNHVPGVGSGQSWLGNRSTIATSSPRSDRSLASSRSISAMWLRSSCSAGSHGHRPVSRTSSSVLISRSRNPSRCAPWMNCSRSTADSSYMR
jgi:hypothetical protein